MTYDLNLNKLSKFVEGMGLNVVGGKFAPPTIGDLPKVAEVRIGSDEVDFERQEDDFIEYVSPILRNRGQDRFTFGIIPSVPLNKMHSASKQSPREELVRGIALIRLLTDNGEEIFGQRDFFCHGPFAGERDYQSFFSCAGKALLAVAKEMNEQAV